MKAFTASDESHRLLMALLSDFREVVPVEAYHSIRSDIDTVHERSMKRGLTILMDDMPGLCKHLDKCLSSDDGHDFEPPHSLVLKSADNQLKGKFPIFWCLFRMVLYIRKIGPNHYRGQVNPSADPNIVLLLRNLLLLFKKVKEDCSDAAKLKAMEEFVTIDKSLPKPTYCWHSSTPPSLQVRETGRLKNEVATNKVWQLLRYVLGHLINLDGMFDSRSIVSRHGPGAVSDLGRGGDKYCFPSWPRKLGRVFPPNEHGSHGPSSPEDSLPEQWGDQWPCARLLAVPKTLSKPRIIASEPTAHMWIQQGLLGWIRENLLLGCLAIDFHSQVPSQVLAREGSRDGRLVTIDLSNASDYLSLHTVERLFGGNLSILDALWASRTTKVEIPEMQQTITLRKFAAMGSAITFPVQSLVYLACAVTAQVWMDGELDVPTPWHVSQQAVERAVRKVRIFGDDIIVPRASYHRTIQLLSFIGMKVNVLKTHSGGLFRESCGMDSFAGCDVSPLYVAHLGWRYEVSQLPSRIAISNNAHMKGLWRLAHELAAPAQEAFGRYIPVSSDPLGCLRLSTFLTGTRAPIPPRWNESFHYWEFQGFGIRVRKSIVGREGWTNLLQYFTESPKQGYLPWLEDPSYRDLGFVDNYRQQVCRRWVPLGEW